MKKAEMKAMSVDELEDYRNGLAKQTADLQVEFRMAGMVKADKIASSPKAKALAKIAEGREELAASAEEEDNG